MGADLTRLESDGRRYVQRKPSHATRHAATMEEAARGVCQVLYDELEARESAGTTRACALVRCFKTHPFGLLEPELQRVAESRMSGAERPMPATRCMTLLASAGDEPEWRSRHTSQRHRCVPLTRDTLLRMPMWENLFQQCGLAFPEVGLQSTTAFAEREFVDRSHRSYSVFCVEQALGSPSVPNQGDFVVPFRIVSVLGFGGQLRGGDIYAVLLFSRVPVSRQAATQLSALALDVTSTLFRFGDAEVFAPH